MTSSKDVEITSRFFFKKHWSPDGGEIPAWSAPFKIEGSNGLITHGNLPGCYAIYNDHDALLYVGVGRSVKQGPYAENALDRRIRGHVYRVDKSSGTYVARSPWKERGATHIRTIGLPQKFFYVSASLEEFLIHELKPPFNRIGGSKK